MKNLKKLLFLIVFLNSFPSGFILAQGEDKIYFDSINIYSDTHVKSTTDGGFKIDYDSSPSDLLRIRFNVDENISSTSFSSNDHDETYLVLANDTLIEIYLSYQSSKRYSFPNTSFRSLFNSEIYQLDLDRNIFEMDLQAPLAFIIEIEKAIKA